MERVFSERAQTVGSNDDAVAAVTWNGALAHCWVADRPNFNPCGSVPKSFAILYIFFL